MHETFYVPGFFYTEKNISEHQRCLLDFLSIPFLFPVLRAHINGRHSGAILQMPFSESMAGHGVSIHSLDGLNGPVYGYGFGPAERIGLCQFFCRSHLAPHRNLVHCQGIGPRIGWINDGRSMGVVYDSRGVNHACDGSN